MIKTYILKLKIKYYHIICHTHQMRAPNALTSHSIHSFAHHVTSSMATERRHNENRRNITENTMPIQDLFKLQVKNKHKNSLKDLIMPSNKEEIIEKGEVKNVDEDMLEKVEFLVATTSSNAASSSNNNKMSTTKKDNKGKSTSTTANKQKRPKKGRKNARKRRFSEASHDELVRKVKERYGTSTKKDELKEAILDRGNGQIHQPDSYQRMMARSVEAHLNRMLQPEPPEDLLPSNWVCAICFQPVAGPTNSCQLGELFGPYFVRLSPKCQPPEQLVPRNLLKSQREKGTNMMVENDGQPSTSAKSSRSHAVSPSGSKKRGREGKRRLPPPLSGTLDLWFHGECALASPKLFLVGGRFPNLEDQIAKCWGTSIDDSTIL